MADNRRESLRFISFSFKARSPMKGLSKYESTILTNVFLFVNFIFVRRSSTKCRFEFYPSKICCNLAELSGPISLLLIFKDSSYFCLARPSRMYDNPRSKRPLSSSMSTFVLRLENSLGTICSMTSCPWKFIWDPL